MLDIENIVDTQSEAEELEEVVMGLIINSGQARSLAYGALKWPSKVISSRLRP